MRTRSPRREPSGALPPARDAGPILLATLGVPLDDEAVEVAVDAAVEAGRRLVVANVTRIEPLSLSLLMGYDALEELTPDVSRSVRRPAEVAASFGLEVELLRVRSPRPVTALLELVRERRPSLVVFGPDPGRIPRRSARKAVAALRAGGGSTLLWVSAER
jgi:nucleotide-binding universal stress UspA family protein